MLEISEREGAVYWTVESPARSEQEKTRLSWHLIDACAGIEQRDQPPFAVVLRSGGTVFCVEPPRSAVDCDEGAETWAEATATVARLGPPTIAMIAGDAIGPAWELALACDLRIASTEARMGSPEIQWGRIPSAGGTQRLLRVGRASLALRMLLLGEVVSGGAALEMGLIQWAAAAPKLDATLENIVNRLRGAAPLSSSYVKESIVKGADLPLDAGLRLEADLSALLQTTDDRVEGIRAFAERRPPRFTGR